MRNIAIVLITASPHKPMITRGYKESVDSRHIPLRFTTNPNTCMGKSTPRAQLPSCVVVLIARFLFRGGDSSGNEQSKSM